jgi:hypothetical protein
MLMYMCGGRPARRNVGDVIVIVTGTAVNRLGSTGSDDSAYILRIKRHTYTCMRVRELE